MNLRCSYGAIGAPRYRRGARLRRGGHAGCQSLEIYSRLALADAQQRYDDVIGDFPL